MIDTLTSPAAQVAANAQAALAEIEQTLAALAAEAEALHTERQQLLDERAPAGPARDALALVVAQAQAEHHRAELAAHISQGTDLAEQTTTAREEASQRLEAACQALQQHDSTWQERGAAIAARLEAIQQALTEQDQRRQDQQGKRVELRSLYQQAHREHGQTEQARLEAAFSAIAERRAIAHQQILDKLETEEAALLHEAAERLKDWPDLARETLALHLVYQPSPLARILTAWQTFAQLVGDSPQAIDGQLWQMFIGRGLPLWELRQQGPRSRLEALPINRRDEPAKQYLGMLAELSRYLARLEQQERERQATAALPRD